MKGRIPQADPELDALLESGKVIPPVPEVVRMRHLSRARATMAAMAALPREPSSVVRRRGLTIALAATLAMAVGAAVATAALLGRVPSSSQSLPPAIPHTERPIHNPTLDVPPSLPSIVPPSTMTTKPQHWTHPATARESYAAELDLLARAQVAYAAREFSEVLARVAEHGRKFPNGRLAEEREALRVRALEGAGRTEEAHRAAAAFADRFPRSIMLPRQGGEPR
jgi:hypothetical protein